MDYNYLNRTKVQKKNIIKELNRKVSPLETEKHYYLVTTYFGSKAVRSHYFETYKEAIDKCSATGIPMYLDSNNELIKITLNTQTESDKQTTANMASEFLNGINTQL